MKQAIEELLSSNDSSQLKEDDRLSVKSIFLNSISDDAINAYFAILSTYLKAKRKKEMSIKDVADTSGFPPTTIKRFENLQTIPQALTLIKILKSVGLELNIVEEQIV